MPRRVAAVPTFDDVCAAHARIAAHVNRTPVMMSRTLDDLAGTQVLLKCETFQRSGAFKARGALNAVLQLTRPKHPVAWRTHSSGNHGGALAWPRPERGIPCYVVMPAGAPRAKVDAVRGYGGHVVECAPTLDAREEKLAEVLAETGAHEVHPYDDRARHRRRRDRDGRVAGGTSGRRPGHRSRERRRTARAERPSRHMA